MEAIFASARPDTVFHVASLIDCRPNPSPALDAVNVAATATLIELCHRHGTRRLVYTSSIEVVYGAAGVPNSSENATEALPYPDPPSQGYQRTKVEGELLVLRANSEALATTAVRPGHIFGAGDDLTAALAHVDVVFGTASRGDAGGAQMSMASPESPYWRCFFPVHGSSSSLWQSPARP